LRLALIAFEAKQKSNQWFCFAATQLFFGGTLERYYLHLLRVGSPIGEKELQVQTLEICFLKETPGKAQCALSPNGMFSLVHGHK
jgi:hypothetical protein